MKLIREFVREQRTLAFGCFMAVILLSGLLICATFRAGPLLFSSFAIACVGLAGAIAGKNAIESLAGGSGIKGAVATLMTNEKPDAPHEVKP